MIYAQRGILWYHFVMIKYKKVLLQILQQNFFTTIFSKKIFHRRSLFHTSKDVYHRFASQIYITVGCAYPYAHPTKEWLFV